MAGQCILLEIYEILSCLLSNYKGACQELRTTQSLPHYNPLNQFAPFFNCRQTLTILYIFPHLPFSFLPFFLLIYILLSPPLSLSSNLFLTYLLLSLSLFSYSPLIFFIELNLFLVLRGFLLCSVGNMNTHTF